MTLAVDLLESPRPSPPQTPTQMLTAAHTQPFNKQNLVTWPMSGFRVLFPCAEGASLLLEIETHRTGRDRRQERQPMVNQAGGGSWNKNKLPPCRGGHWRCSLGAGSRLGLDARPLDWRDWRDRRDPSGAWPFRVVCAATPQGDDDGLDRVGPEIARARDMGPGAC